MKFKLSLRDVLCLSAFTLIVALCCYLIYDNREIKQGLTDNSENLNVLSSGMSLDESRLRKVMQTEKIAHYYNPTLKPEFVHSLAISIVDGSSRYPNIDHLLLCALIAHESKFRPDTISPAGAKGLTQIMDETAEWISLRFTWTYYDGIAYDPEKNVLMGAWYLSRMIDFNRGNVEYALACYNGGPKYGSIYKLSRSGKLSSEQLEIVKNLPNETNKYPGKVFKEYEFIKRKFKFNLTQS